MKVDFIHDGWAFTTPVYAGTEADVNAMLRHQPHQFEDLPVEICPPSIGIQQCSCGAKRAKYPLPLPADDPMEEPMEEPHHR